MDQIWRRCITWPKVIKLFISLKLISVKSYMDSTSLTAVTLFSGPVSSSSFWPFHTP